MERPKRQTRKPGKYDDEFIIPAEAAEMYWEANTRKVYRYLTDKDVKSSLKDTTVYILWPNDGKWYLAEVEQMDVRKRVAYLRYPETHEEEQVNLDELIQERCISVVEHLSRATKLKRSREVPCTPADAEGAVYETDDEAEPQQQQQGTPRQQQQSARKLRTADDEDYHEDSDIVMSDDEKLDSDAHVSDDQAPSGSDDESLAARAQKSAKKQHRHSSSSTPAGNLTNRHQQRSGKLNTPSRGNGKPMRPGTASGGGGIGPVAAPGHLRGMPADPAAAAAGGMVFVPLGATGTASAVGHSAGNGAVLWSDGSGEGSDLQHRGLLGKRRISDGSGAMHGSEAKRRAAAAAEAETAAGPSSDAFKKAMLEKLLAKRQQGSGSGAAAAAAGGSARVSTSKMARGVSGIERRLSASGSANLQRAMSDVDVRQKAAGQLVVGLKRAVEEAQEKHKNAQRRQPQQQQQQPVEQQPQQQREQQGWPQPGSEQDGVMAEAVVGSEQQPQQQPPQQQPNGTAAAADTAAASDAAGAGATTADARQQPTADQHQQLAEQALQQQQSDQSAAIPELPLGDPQELANTIEQHLYELCGSLNVEYKSKMRSLAFNLRDPQNPDLRGHVLTGEISPANLVRMSAADLANKDLAEWRRKIEEEHNKAIELDVETAAKYSTAAAWATREELMRRTQVALLGTLATEDNKRGTPEPPQRAAAGKEYKAANTKRNDTDSGAAAGAEGTEGEAADVGDNDHDHDHDMDEGGGTPTRPAPEDGEDAFAAAAAAGLYPSGDSIDMEAAVAGDAAAGDDSLLLQQRSDLPSSPTAAAASGGGLLSAVSVSQGGHPAGSGAAAAAGSGSAALHQVGSVSSKSTPTAAGGIFAGIDWAAIKKDAVKASKEQQQQTPKQAADNTPAAAASHPSAAAAVGAEEAPYNPDDDNDDQPYDPTEGADHDSPPQGTHAAAAAAGSTPTEASLAAGSRSTNTGRLDPNLLDMLPVIAAPRSSRSSTTGHNWPAPGDTVWTGRVAVPAAGSFGSRVQQVGGMGEVGLMLGPFGAVIDVIGRVDLHKFASFAEELRKSRSRTISLGLVRCADGADPADAAYMSELVRSYISKGRIGKLGLVKEVEGYLVAQSEFSARLLKTAALVTPPNQQHLIPQDVTDDEFLLLIVHRKDYIPPKLVQLPPPPPQHQQQQVLPGLDAGPPGLGPLQQQRAPGMGPPSGSGEGAKLDPRRRAAMAAAAAAVVAGPPQQQQLPPGVVPPGPPPAVGHATGPVPLGGLPPPPATAVASAAAPSAASGLDLSSLSALAAALGLPGGPAPPAAGAAAPPAMGEAAPALAAQTGGGGGGGAAGGVGPPSGDQPILQMQSVPSAGGGGPPPPPGGASARAGQHTFRPSQGPASAGAPGDLTAAMKQIPEQPDPMMQQHQQHQQKQYTVDMRSMPPSGGPGPDQSVVFDLRQPQQQPLPPPPDLGPGPPPGAAGGAPVIILPPGAPVPAPGTMNIPDGAVFMTQDLATGSLVPVGPQPPQHMMPPPMQQYPGPPRPPPGPPPSGYGMPEGGQMGFPGPHGMEGHEGFGPPGGFPPPPHVGPPPGGPRGPGGGGPRPMMRRF